MLDARFEQRDDGVVDVRLPQEWSALEDTLLDAVTTRAPRGSDLVNPSTSWIDRCLADLDGAADGTVVASGNATDLVVDGDDVVAHSHHAMFDNQRVTRSDLVDLLARWHASVVEHVRAGRTRVQLDPR